MEIDFTEEKIKKQFDGASPAIKDILLDTWITEDMTLIGKNLELRIDKVNGVIRIIGYVMLNLIPLSRLISAIDKETNLGNEKSEEIAKKVDKIIFTKIRQKVREYKKPEESIDKDLKNETVDEEYLKKSLLKDIENHANEFSGNKKGNKKMNNNETFADMLDKSKTIEVDQKIVDPYRNII